MRDRWFDTSKVRAARPYAPLQPVSRSTASPGLVVTFRIIGIEPSTLFGIPARQPEAATASCANLLPSQAVTQYRFASDAQTQEIKGKPDRCASNRAFLQRRFGKPPWSIPVCRTLRLGRSVGAIGLDILTNMLTTRAAMLLVFVTAQALAQRSSGPPKGILVVDGGGTSKPVVEEFIRLAGGPKAKIVVIPTGASSLRFGAEKICSFFHLLYYKVV